MNCFYNTIPALPSKIQKVSHATTPKSSPAQISTFEGLSATRPASNAAKIGRSPFPCPTNAYQHMTHYIQSNPQNAKSPIPNSIAQVDQRSNVQRNHASSLPQLNLPPPLLPTQPPRMIAPRARTTRSLRRPPPIPSQPRSLLAQAIRSTIRSPAIIIPILCLMCRGRCSHQLTTFCYSALLFCVFGEIYAEGGAGCVGGGPGVSILGGEEESHVLVYAVVFAEGNGFGVRVVRGLPRVRCVAWGARVRVRVRGGIYVLEEVGVESRVVGVGLFVERWFL